MKKLLTNLIVIFITNLVFGCGGGSENIISKQERYNIAVLSLGTDMSTLSPDQIVLLQRTLNWMDNNIMTILKKHGFLPRRINSENNFSSAGNCYLLKISINNHKLVGARAWVGMMAGADRIGAHFDLVDPNHKTVLSWDDTQASTRGGTYCAQKINRNAINRIANYFRGL